MKQHLATVNTFAKRLIKERHEEEEAAKLSDIKYEKGDLLSRFMRAVSRNGQTLDDNELRDTILNFIIAGRDTTAQALSWTFYQLMLFPEIQEKVHAEAEQFITEEVEADPSKLYTVIQDMVYSHAVYVVTWLFDSALMLCVCVDYSRFWDSIHLCLATKRRQWRMIYGLMEPESIKASKYHGSLIAKATWQRFGVQMQKNSSQNDGYPRLMGHLCAYHLSNGQHSMPALAFV